MEIEKYEKKLRTVLTQAFDRGHDTVILGAWGCGYARVPAIHATKIIGRIISTEFAHAFKEIVFAVIDDNSATLAHNAPFNSNFQVFKKFIGDVRDNKLNSSKCTIF